MNTLTLSEHLYKGLAQSARQRGKSIEELLEQWLREEAEKQTRDRKRVVENIMAFQHEMSAKYGKMPDSTPLLREDRDR